MIDDLTKTLREMLLRAHLPRPLGEALISFERPAENFKPKDQPTVNLFLYDIRENTTLRNNELSIERTNGVVTMHRAPLRVACSYLVTAWSVEAGEIGLLQEHQLLGQVLQVFSTFNEIPRGLLQGRLADQPTPPPLVTAMIDPQKNFSEFWTALGNRLRPSLTITSTIAITVTEPERVPMVSTARMNLTPPLDQGETPRRAAAVSQQEVRASAARGDGRGLALGLFSVRGRVLGDGDSPVAGATVSLLQFQGTAITDAAGRYTLEGVRGGACTLRVEKAGQRRDFAVQVPSDHYDLPWR